MSKLLRVIVLILIAGIIAPASTANADVDTANNVTVNVGFGNLNGVRDMLVPANAEAVLFSDECGEITKVG